MSVDEITVILSVTFRTSNRLYYAFERAGRPIVQGFSAQLELKGYVH